MLSDVDVEWSCIRRCNNKSSTAYKLIWCTMVSWSCSQSQWNCMLYSEMTIRHSIKIHKFSYFIDSFSIFSFFAAEFLPNETIHFDWWFRYNFCLFDVLCVHGKMINKQPAFTWKHPKTTKNNNNPNVVFNDARK